MRGAGNASPYGETKKSGEKDGLPRRKRLAMTGYYECGGLRSCYDAQRDPHVILSEAKNPLNQLFRMRFFVAMLLRMTVF